MKMLFVSIVLIASSMSFAQDHDLIQMHENMAKAHRQAAECLKSGKPEVECQNAFREMCEGFGVMQCGPGMRHQKMLKKGK